MLRVTHHWSELNRIAMFRSLANRCDGPLRVLLIDREIGSRQALAKELAASLVSEPRVSAVASGRPGAEALRAEDFDLVAADLVCLYDLAPTADQAIARLAKLAPASLLLVFSDEASVSATVAAMGAGAHDHVTRSLSTAHIAKRLQEIEQRQGRSGAGAPVPLAPRSAAAPDSVSGWSNRPPVLPMWRHEQRIIAEAIQSFGGNVALAAEALELSPSTLYRKRQAWAELEGQ